MNIFLGIVIDTEIRVFFSYLFFPLAFSQNVSFVSLIQPLRKYMYSSDAFILFSSKKCANVSLFAS